jgi:hypothetical protein
VITQDRCLSESAEDVPPEMWLMEQVHEFEKNYDREVIVPKRPDGLDYSFHALYPDQQQIVLQVMSKVHEFMECDNLNDFQPLRMTINGAGGSGKSVVINTLVTLMRKMFDMNDVIKVVAPTGTAAFNVKGETLHHLCCNKVSRSHYKANTMPKDKRMQLIKRFKALLVLIVDERSLINSCDLGTVECQIGETIFGGGHLSQESFGGLPVVILAGDDYQLPGTLEGAIGSIFNKGGSEMTRRGRSALLDCSKFVMQLDGSKRMKDSEVQEKRILEKLRVAEELSEQDIAKLLSLDLRVMERKHGRSVVQEICDRAIFLFYTNEKRRSHNLRQVLRHSSKTNPVAILQPQSTGPMGRKGIASHFEGKLPESSLLCVGARVALDNRNFNPIWGLHNGACGIVEEIIFQPGKSPNNGDLPLYVVVNFPLYDGPVWDSQSPKVSSIAYVIKSSL